ncbi:coniferyl aldehyde dehydrogenase [Pseudomonas sp.]|uniref:coniferyl aldehyde dehydrogenase n=1 Tax=Pseudomonas sp. TaxID=306 RepID=UPI003BB5B527
MSNIETSEVLRMREILAKQRSAYLANDIWTAEQRCELFDRLIGMLVVYKQEIVEATAADFGHRSHDLTRIIDLLGPLSSLKKTKGKIAEWMQPEQRAVDRGEAWIQYQPLGVVGIVTAWNFPVGMVIQGLASALSAGNRAMVKVSELTPACSALMQRMFSATFAEDEIAIVTGGAEVGQAFCSLPFDHLLFTGASSIGKQVMRAAAENLVPVTLELGGKSPTIVSRSADLKSAVSKIMAGKLLNAGQVCLAPDHVFVAEESVDEFIALAKSTVAKLYPTLKDNPDYTSVINARHFERLQGYLAEARAAGVELIEVNPAGEDFADQAHHKLIPTLLRDPGDELRIMQDEIFGPLLPIKPYKDMREVVAYINAHPRPLGLYYFGSDAAEEQFVLERTVSGGVTLNNVALHASVDSLPFGGVGNSGMGSYLGHQGFVTFSHPKPIFRSVEGPDITRPPFTDQVRQMVDAMIKR